jgi:hypothetical protein
VEQNEPPPGLESLRDHLRPGSIEALGRLATTLGLVASVVSILDVGGGVGLMLALAAVGEAPVFTALVDAGDGPPVLIFASPAEEAVRALEPHGRALVERLRASLGEATAYVLVAAAGSTVVVGRVRRAGASRPEPAGPAGGDPPCP